MDGDDILLFFLLYIPQLYFHSISVPPDYLSSLIVPVRGLEADRVWKANGSQQHEAMMTVKWTFICVKWPHKWPNKNKHPHMLITEELCCAICNMIRIPISAFYYHCLANQMTVFIVQTQCSVNGCYVKFVQFAEAEFEYIYEGI